MRYHLSLIHIYPLLQLYGFCYRVHVFVSMLDLVLMTLHYIKVCKISVTEWLYKHWWKFTYLRYLPIKPVPTKRMSKKPTCESVVTIPVFDLTQYYYFYNPGKRWVPFATVCSIFGIFPHTKGSGRIAYSVISTITSYNFWLDIGISETTVSRWVMPVSYTHLDVYKRQYLFCTEFHLS